jgi:hypothetical protein
MIDRLEAERRFLRRASIGARAVALLHRAAPGRSSLGVSAFQAMTNTPKSTPTNSGRRHERAVTGGRRWGVRKPGKPAVMRECREVAGRSSGDYCGKDVERKGIYSVFLGLDSMTSSETESAEMPPKIPPPQVPYPVRCGAHCFRLAVNRR